MSVLTPQQLNLIRRVFVVLCLVAAVLTDAAQSTDAPEWIPLLLAGIAGVMTRVRWLERLTDSDIDNDGQVG